MAEIRRLENRHDVIVFCRGCSDLVKFRRLVQNDMSTTVMWSKSKPDVEFQYGGRLGEFNGMSSQSHIDYRLLSHSAMRLSETAGDVKHR